MSRLPYPAPPRTAPHPAAEPRPRTLIVIPARNEAGRVEAVIEGLRRHLPETTILVVDDGSEDDTAERARSVGATLLRLPFNLGYGAALHTGYKFALKNGFSRVLQVDADGQHDPASAPGLLAAQDETGADVVIGSRYLVHAPPPCSLLRRLGSRLFAAIVRTSTGVSITDPTSGFKVYSQAAVEALAQEGFPDDFPDADVLIALHRQGYQLIEVPAVMHVRQGGVSMHSGLRFLYYGYKMSLSILLSRVRRSSPYRREWRKERTG